MIRQCLKVACVAVLLLVFINPIALAVGENDRLWHHETYEKKVYQVGHQIIEANHIKTQISFFVMNAKEPNAGAESFTDTVVVYKPILKYIESDDELAAILSHEISHILHHDSQRGFLKRTLVDSLLAGYAFSHHVYVSPLQRLFGGHMMAAGQRKEESEADATGVDLMVKAGYNPMAMVSIFSKITNDGSWYVMHDHPWGSKLQAAILKIIATKYPQFLEDSSKMVNAKTKTNGQAVAFQSNASQGFAMVMQTADLPSNTAFQSDTRQGFLKVTQVFQ